MTPNINAAVVEVIDGEMTGKKWYYSKTFWANVVRKLGGINRKNIE